MQQIYILLCGFQSTNSDRFSGDGYEDPPVPISNTVVKLINAESTWLETAWEDRKPLIKLKAHLRVCLFLYVKLNVYITYTLYIRKYFLNGIFLIIQSKCDILIICLSGLE